MNFVSVHVRDSVSAYDSVLVHDCAHACDLSIASASAHARVDVNAIEIPHG